MFTVSPSLDRRHRAVGIFMAGTSTVPQFADRVIDPRLLHLLVLFLLVVICVAPCAIWRISAERPGYALAVTLVTIDAPNGGRVVTWIVTRHVAVGENRCPVVGTVTFIALQ